MAKCQLSVFKIQDGGVVGGGGTLIVSYIRRLGSFFGVQNFKFQYFLGFFRKINIFGGLKIL